MNVRVTDNTREVKEAMREAQRTALEASAQLVEGEAILRCPVDTGNLRSSITHIVNDDNAVVGTNVEYAPYPEYKGQAYLRPALDQNKDNIKRLFSQTVSNALRR